MSDRLEHPVSTWLGILGSGILTESKDELGLISLIVTCSILHPLEQLGLKIIRLLFMLLSEIDRLLCVGIDQRFEHV